MNCRTFRVKLQDYLDHVLEDGIVQEMKQHSISCQDCSAFEQQWLWISKMTQDLPRLEAPSNFEVRLRARLRKESPRLPAFWFPFPTPAFRFAALGILFLVAGLSAFFLYPRHKTGEMQVTSSQPKNTAYPVSVPASARMVEYSEPALMGDWPPEIQLRGEGGEYVEYLLKGTGKDEIMVRMPKTIRVKPPGENDQSYFRYISH